MGLLAAVSLSGCYSLAEPSFNPGDQRDVYQAIVRRGLVVSEPLAGATACDDRDLIANTLYLTARSSSDAEPRDVYIHVYRERRWDESAAEVDACQATYAEANPGSTITRLDIPTYRVFGADWSEELAAEIEAALIEASDAG